MKSVPVFALSLLVGMMVLVCPTPAFGIPFCMVSEPLTWRQEAAEAEFVVYGTLRNSRRNPDGSGTTELVIEAIVKDHPFLKNKKVLEVPRYIPAAEGDKDPPHYLLFFDLDKGKPDPCRGIPATRTTVRYLQGLRLIDNGDRLRLLRYCFDYLEHSDPEIASDAFLEFKKSTDAEFRKVGPSLPAEKLHNWLIDPRTPAHRLDLYAFLLGHCGTAEDGDLLRNLAAKHPGSDGFLTGYVLLRPKEGWAHVRQLLRDGKQDFRVRYSALRAARSFHTTRPAVVSKEEAEEAVTPLLDQADIADLAIDDLRRWGRWDLTNRILALVSRPSHSAPFIRRALLRYALQSPGAAAAKFVGEARKANPAEVADMEEILREQAKWEGGPSHGGGHGSTSP
jgi:hypothetical protein